MKQLWMGGVGLALSWLAAGWAAGQSPAPPVLQVSLGRPEAIEDSPGAPVTRVSFHHAPNPVYRMQNPEPFQADAVRSKPMPVGPAEGGFAAGNNGSTRTSAFASEAEPEAIAPPKDGPSKRVIASSGPVTSAPVGDCCDTACDPCEPCGDCCEPCHKKIWGCCKLCSNCCPLDPHKFYFSAEYLLWWIKPGSTPPLVTTGPFIPGNELGSSGILGQPGTVVLFQDLEYDAFSGGRFTLGWWTDPCCQSCAFEVSGLFLGERSAGFSADSSQFPVLARPFFNGNDGIEFSEITARPDLATGSIFIDAPSQLWGVEANVRCNVCCGCHSRWDLLAGVRYLDLQESLTIVENINVTATNTTFPAGSQVVVVDSFSTHNQFYGGQIGLVGQLRKERWSLDLRAKLALGVTQQSVDVFGAQVVRTPTGAVQTFPGGLLALSSNIGHYSSSKFTVIPEIGVNLGYDVTQNLRVMVGYTFLYWSNVVRPGDQIDRVLNINQIPNFSTSPNPGPNRPLMPFKGTDFWAQGVNVGLEYRY